ncbi:hypothetical protein GCM10027063_28510 [Promicromonospora xylanilytica]
MQLVLVIVLLAMTGLAGFTAAEPPAVAMSVGSAVEAGPGSGSEVPVLADDDGSHAHDTITLLCLCALAAVRILLTAGLRASRHWPRRRPQRTALLPRLACVSSPLTSADPLSWGVCRI